MTKFSAAMTQCVILAAQWQMHACMYACILISEAMYMLWTRYSHFDKVVRVCKCKVTLWHESDLSFCVFTHFPFQMCCCQGWYVLEVNEIFSVWQSSVYERVIFDHVGCFVHSVSVNALSSMVGMSTLTIQTGSLRTCTGLVCANTLTTRLHIFHLWKYDASVC